MVELFFKREWSNYFLKTLTNFQDRFHPAWHKDEGKVEIIGKFHLAGTKLKPGRASL